MATHTAVQLASTVPSTTGVGTLYTAPTSTTTMVQYIAITNIHSSSILADIKLKDVFLRSQVSIAAGATFEWSGFLVLNAGETLKLQVNTANVAHVSIAGVEIS